MPAPVSWPRLLLALAAGFAAGVLVWLPLGFLVWLWLIEPAVEQRAVDLGIWHFEGESSGEPFPAGADAYLGAAVFYATLLVVVALGVLLALRLIARARPRWWIVLAVVVLTDLLGIELVGRQDALAGLAIVLLAPVLSLRWELARHAARAG